MYIGTVDVDGDEKKKRAPRRRRLCKQFPPGDVFKTTYARTPDEKFAAILPPYSGPADLLPPKRFLPFVENIVYKKYYQVTAHQTLRSTTRKNVVLWALT